ncbi:MAG: DUF692 domain-containing protein [Thiohalomonadales bacterium]
MSKVNKPASLGYGLGLRHEYYHEILEHHPPVDWFEILSENYMVEGGKPLYYLDAIRESYPIVMHGVAMSIGSTNPLNMDYLKDLKNLASRVKPRWISDHLCWAGYGSTNLHDLMPLPYNEETIKHVVQRVKRVQDYLGEIFLLENVSSYVTYTHSEMTEWEFISAIVEEADCMMLLDINNIYVSARNHGFDAMDYINGVPIDRIQQFHLAGHSDYGDYVIDTHDHPVVDTVWALYEKALKRFGAVSTMIERDDRMPPFSELLDELAQARDIGASILGSPSDQASGYNEHVG